MISSTLPGPLASLLTQIERANDAQLYYSALAIAFTLPDVCAALEADKDKPYWSNKEKYIGWFDRNVAKHFEEISGEDCYYMRGGVVHWGQFRHAKSKFDRVLFLIPGSSVRGHDVTVSFDPGITFSGLSREEALGSLAGRQPTGNVLLMDVVEFCNTMIQAVCDWSLTKLDDDNFRFNIKNLVHYRPQGISPLLVGVPVIG